MTINLWYDYVNNSEIVNNLIPSEQRQKYVPGIPSDSFHLFLKDTAELPHFLQRNNIDFSINISQTIPYLKNYNWDVTQFLPVEIFNFNRADSSQLNFDESFFLKNRIANTEILLWHATEAPDNVLFDRFDIINKKFPNVKVRFVSGNLKTPQWVSERDFMIYKPLDYFWWRQQLEPKVALDKNKEEQYTFTFYNHRNKIHRSIPYYTMMNAGWLDNARHTYHGQGAKEETPEKEVRHEIKYTLMREKLSSGPRPEEYSRLIEDSQFLRWAESRITRSHRFTFNNFVDSSLHNGSYLDLAAETYQIERPDHFFITEKTYRPIANGCVFLILGQPGILQYLKSKGIETFDDIFDESYDTTQHWFNRWKIIEKNISIWLQMGKAGRDEYYKKNFDKLVHNQNVLYERSFKTEIENLFV